MNLDEAMLSVCAESKPLMTAHGVLRVYDVLEVSIFPGIPYELSIQLAVDFYESLFTFFFSDRGPARPSHSSSAAPTTTTFTTTTTTTIMDDMRTNNEDHEDEVVSLQEEKDEVFYFKYVRVGQLCLRIACHGFVVNLNGFALELPPFVTRGKLCSWKKLLRKFEGHLAWHVTKESASSGLQHVKRRFLTNFKQKTKQKVPQRGVSSTADKTEVDTKENVLFGPYTKAATLDPPPLH